MKRLSSLLLLVGLALGVTAQADKSPKDYFDQAAQQYIDGEKLEAVQTLKNGLDAHPSDAHMTRLAEALLKQMEQDQQQQQQQQEKQQAKQEEQEDQEDQGDKGDGEKQESKGSDKKDKEEDGENSGDEETDKDPSDTEGEDGEKDQDGENGTEKESTANSGKEGEPKDPNKLSKSEAERILKSLNEQDKKARAKALKATQGQKGKSKPSDKDW